MVFFTISFTLHSDIVVAAVAIAVPFAEGKIGEEEGIGYAAGGGTHRANGEGRETEPLPAREREKKGKRKRN